MDTLPSIEDIKMPEFISEEHRRRHEKLFKRPWCPVDWQGYLDADGNPILEEEKEKKCLNGYIGRKVR